MTSPATCARRWTSSSPTPDTAGSRLRRHGTWRSTGSRGCRLSDAADVYIRVDRGVVTLSGSVNRRSDEEIAARMIQRVHGLVDVIEPYARAHTRPSSW
ncbi:BON domain-containing protein [Nonomuraea sp. NEAU-L178]|nr:BON domain-containing protein [Nonomuraea aurantiaca]